MSNMIQGSLASIKKASRRPIWEEPNLQYDGTEPPKAWLSRLKQLRQIHGYNDKEIVHIAERCMRGSAQLWFRIRQPKSLEALRTGLHTRFASGPVLVPAAVLGQLSPGRLGSISPDKFNPRKIIPSVVQWDVATKSPPPTRLELVAKPQVSADDDIGRNSCASDNTSTTTHRTEGSQVDLNSSDALSHSKSHNNSSNFDRASDGSDSSISKYGLSGLVYTGGKAMSFSRSNPNGRGSQDSKVLQAKSLSNVKSKEIQTGASSSNAREGEKRKDKWAKSMDTASVTLSSVSRRISAKDVLDEDGSKNLPTSCKTLPVNWQEALLRFKHAIHLAMRGDWTQMSSDFCKYYLLCYRMRTSGSKRELVHRIRDHLELSDGSGAHKYPRSSFLIDCAGVVCLGDVILFEQKLRAGFDVLNGNELDNSTRTVVGRVVKDSKNLSSHQQPFTVEVYWSKGPEAFRPMRPLCITARDLFPLRPFRQRWINEDARKELLDEKRNCTLEKKDAYNNPLSKKELSQIDHILGNPIKTGNLQRIAKLREIGSEGHLEAEQCMSEMKKTPIWSYLESVHEKASLNGAKNS